MDQTEVLKMTLSKQANRIANLTLDLDLAHSQIDLLQTELGELKKQKEKSKE